MIGRKRTSLYPPLTTTTLQRPLSSPVHRVSPPVTPCFGHFDAVFTKDMHGAEGPVQAGWDGFARRRRENF